MKLFSYVTLGLLASADAAQKRSKKSKKVKMCHSIKKGENIAPLIEPESKKSTCKCLAGWKKSKSTDPLDGIKKHSCNRANYSLLKRASMVRVVEGANVKDGEAAWAEEQATSRNCVYVRDAHWIKCDNYGMDNKKIKKLILPYTVESADLSNNHLTELVRTQWEGLMNLKKISFRNNFLKKIPISVLKAAYGLESIDISYNQLSELNSSGVFKKNVNVKSFKANNNMLKDIKKKVISSWKHLEYIDVSNNRMTKLSGGMLVHAVDLWYVNFSNNKINKLATKAFSNNMLLRELHLNNNAISNINKNVFSKLPNLEILDLSYNKIGEGNGGSIVVYLVSQVNGSKVRFCMCKTLQIYVRTRETTNLTMCSNRPRVNQKRSRHPSRRLPQLEVREKTVAQQQSNPAHFAAPIQGPQKS